LVSCPARSTCRYGREASAAPREWWSGVFLLAGFRADGRCGMELGVHPGSLGLTRFLPGNQSPGRGFFFSEHQELSEVTRPASEEPRIPAVRPGVPSSPPRDRRWAGQPWSRTPGLLVAANW